MPKIASPTVTSDGMGGSYKYSKSTKDKGEYRLVVLCILITAYLILHVPNEAVEIGGAACLMLILFYILYKSSILVRTCSTKATFRVLGLETVPVYFIPSEVVSTKLS